MFGSGWLAIPDVQEWLVGPPRCSGVVGRLAGCPGLVKCLSQMSRSGRRPSRLFGSDR